MGWGCGVAVIYCDFLVALGAISRASECRFLLHAMCHGVKMVSVSPEGSCDGSLVPSGGLWVGGAFKRWDLAGVIRSLQRLL